MARIGLFNGTAFGLRYKMMSTIFPVANKLNENKRPKSSKSDVMDSFTTDIMVKRADKLKKTPKIDRGNKKQNLQPFLEKVTKNISTIHRQNIDIRNLERYDLDSLITVVVNGDDCETFDKIIEQILKYQILPSENVLLKVLSFMCKQNDGKGTKSVNDLIGLCQLKNVPFYENDRDLAPFVAQCLWESGNYYEALNTLQQLLSDANNATKATVRQNYRTIVKDTFLNKGEAVSNIVTTHAIQVYESNSDATILLYIWCDSFTSDLFSDTQLANSLFDKYEALRDLVSPETSRFSIFLLQCHDVSAVQRLIEQLLAHGMMEECRTCMSLLFDYQYWRKDSRACSEIVKTGLDLKIPLSNHQMSRLVKLILNNKDKIEGAPNPKTDTVKPQFKF